MSSNGDEGCGRLAEGEKVSIQEDSSRVLCPFEDELEEVDEGAVEEYDL